MPLLFAVRRAALCFCRVLLLALPISVLGQTNSYAPYGTQYPVIGSLPGDQVWPDVAVTTGGGFVVWQDNITDGSGWGVSARQLDGTLAGKNSTFRVNVQGTNNQENPRVALLKGGGAAFVWQGGQPSYQHIYARFLAANYTWMTTNDVLLSMLATNMTIYTTNVTITITTNWNASHRVITGYATNKTTTITASTISGLASFQMNPALAVLNNGNVVVVWSSYNQAGTNSMLDVYGQILSPAGQKIGTNFLINQFTAYNQRTPAIAALKNGGFVVAWVSEQERAPAPAFANASDYVTATAAPVPSMDIYARLYGSDGTALSNEFLVNTDSNPCASPAVAGAADGSFMVTWCARNMANLSNGLDIYARSFSSAGAGGAVVPVNSYLYGDQYLPHISVIGGDYMIVWTSMGQDGSREGVFGQIVHEDGSLVGVEFRVNTTTIGSQMQPAVASDGVSQFLVVWTSFTGITYGFDLFAQRYQNAGAALQPMSAPFVWAPFTLSNGVYQPQLQVSWPLLQTQGISVSNYEVYVDGAAPPVVLTASNIWNMTAANGLTASSTHSFQVDYWTTDGRQSPISPAASGTTWGGYYWGTAANPIPVEWMSLYYGPQSSWPANVNAPLIPGGPTLYQVFLSGGNPLDPSTWLTTSLATTAKGQLYLSWNTQPGLTYQVQMSADLVTWSNLPPPNDAPRFAAGYSDSIYVGGGSVGYYRVLLLRQ
ncbi:MAG: hypothetical protein ACLQAH_06480 [Limisphaerales bacterium]